MNPPERPHLADKPLGATPLEALGLLRERRPELGQQKLAYAGRLDPMASGLLVVLGGELLARQEEFWNLDKEYTAAVILGFRTDSYDLLGLADAHMPAGPVVPSERVLTTAAQLVGKTILPVPAFSSTVLHGKPLFEWARQGLAGDMQIPMRRMTVQELEVLDLGVIDRDTLMHTIQTRIPLVQGDFRQAAILERWSDLLGGMEGLEWPLLRLRVRCAGGTYIRSLAHELGRRLGTGAVLADLRRVRVGTWSVDDPAVTRLSWPR